MATTTTATTTETATTGTTATETTITGTAATETTITGTAATETTTTGTTTTIDPAAARYTKKIEAYFMATLGRPATKTELADFASKLADNNGSVWKSGLVNYLAEQAGLEATPNANNVDLTQLVTDMYHNLTGSTQLPPEALDYYIQGLETGAIKAKGLAHAIINDFGLMPRADGTLSARPGWQSEFSDDLEPDEKEFVFKRIDLTDKLSEKLAETAEDQFASDETIHEEIKNILDKISHGEADEQTALSELFTLVKSKGIEIEEDDTEENKIEEDQLEEDKAENEEESKLLDIDHDTDNEDYVMFGDNQNEYGLGNALSSESAFTFIDHDQDEYEVENLSNPEFSFDDDQDDDQIEHNNSSTVSSGVENGAVSLVGVSATGGSETGYDLS